MASCKFIILARIYTVKFTFLKLKVGHLACASLEICQCHEAGKKRSREGSTMARPRHILSRHSIHFFPPSFLYNVVMYFVYHVVLWLFSKTMMSDAPCLIICRFLIKICVAECRIITHTFQASSDSSHGRLSASPANTKIFIVISSQYI